MSRKGNRLVRQRNPSSKILFKHPITRTRAQQGYLRRANGPFSTKQDIAAGCAGKHILF